MRIAAISAMVLVSALAAAPQVAAQALDRGSVAPRAAADTGRVGLRRTRDNAAGETGIEPMARINNRVGNRVQARLRNRIDRNYDPQANAAAPFAVANERTRIRSRRE